MAFPLPTIIVSLGDEKYLADQDPVASLRQIPGFSSEIGHPLPVTVISLSEHVSPVTASGLEKTYFEPYLNSDDVICEEFLSHIIFCLKPGMTRPKIESLPGCVKEHQFYDSDLDLCGPYLLFSSQLHKIFRLFPDPYGAFVCGVLGNERYISSYREAPTQDIPVPSRLYYPKASESQPLMGKRIAVKDIYDMRGLKTGAGSKAYLEYQQPATSTADAIQWLVNQGAVIVGKAKNTQFVSGMAPRDWVDYQCPFNPRGDGYLDTDCSSSGSAAAMAGYKWLDCAIGSDSLGSMVGPAAACGLYGVRPTQGILSNEGAVAVSSMLDTPGHFCRDIDTFSRIAKHWFPETSPQSTELPKCTRLFVLKERFNDFRDSERSHMENFIQDFEKALHVTRTNLDVEALWRESAPEDLRATKLHEYLSTTLATIQLYDSYQNNLPFRSGYRAKFGIDPALDELVRYKWNLGSSISKEQYDAACAEAGAFKTFLETKVVGEGTVVLLPGGMPQVQYRDSYPGDLEVSGKPWQGYGFTNTAFSSLGGLPCVSFPVGQTAYASKHSGREELKPVSLWMLGATGTDAWLIDLVGHVMKKSGRPTSVKIGKTAF